MTQPLYRRLVTCAVALLCLFAALPVALAVPTRPQIDVTGYTIDATLDPAASRLSATVVVSFTAAEDLSLVTFGLNNGLDVKSVTDATGKPLTVERVATDSTVRVTPLTPLAKGTQSTWTFTYAGAPTVDTSPVDGLNFATVTDPITTLLYPGRWFPISMPGLFTDRFTATTRIVVPVGERVVGSGFTGQKPVAGGVEWSFAWDKANFPGTLVAGRFDAPYIAPGLPNVRVFTTEKHKDVAKEEAANVGKQLEYFSGIFGGLDDGRIDVVELPATSVSAAWAPGVVAIRADRASVRLLANTVAHQWWGAEVSPYTLNDAWITNGMSRYAELMYLQSSVGETAYQNAIVDTSAGALAYDTDPLSTLGHLDPFSPQFQSMTLEKGAMVFHMLRWELGDAAFDKLLASMVTQYDGKGIRAAEVQQLAEKASGGDTPMTAFFSEWVDGTGAPDFGNKYTVFREGDNKGFRTTGEVTEDLDLFRMPVELKIETEGKTEIRRVDLAGSDSPYSVETFGRPRRITLDPDNWLLKSTPDLAVRVAVLRGQQDVAQGDLIAAIAEYQKALDANKQSSLANYRLGEVFMTQRNYQSAANTFRDALRGDGDPRWTGVWSHIQLGRIFDITGQRDRAVNEYRQAVQTNDNTQGAVNEARASMAKPYKLPVAD